MNLCAVGTKELTNEKGVNMEELKLKHIEPKDLGVGMEVMVSTHILFPIDYNVSGYPGWRLCKVDFITPDRGKCVMLSEIDGNAFTVNLDERPVFVRDMTYAYRENCNACESILGERIWRERSSELNWNEVMELADLLTRADAILWRKLVEE